MKSSEKVQKHVWNIHEKTVEYKWKICDKNFSSKTYTKRHSEVCSNKVSIIHWLKCQTQSLKFIKSLADVQVRVQNIHEKTVEYKCKSCNKNFSSKAYIERHSKVCSNKIPIIQWLKLQTLSVTKNMKSLADHVQNIHEKIVKC